MSIRAAYASYKEIRLEIIMAATIFKVQAWRSRSGFANPLAALGRRLALNSRKES